MIYYTDKIGKKWIRITISLNKFFITKHKFKKENFHLRQKSYDNQYYLIKMIYLEFYVDVRIGL